MTYPRPKSKTACGISYSPKPERSNGDRNYFTNMLSGLRRLMCTVPV